MVLVPFWGVGYVCLVPIATNMFFKQSSAYREQALTVYGDTAARAGWERAADIQASLGLRFSGVGLAIWLITIPMIWWWLSARRRNFN